MGGRFRDQRAASGRDVHDQRFVGPRIVPVGCGWFVFEDQPRVLFIRGAIFEEPDVQNVDRVLREVILFKFLHGPFDRFFSVLFTTSFGSSPTTTNGGCTTIEKSFDGILFLNSTMCWSNCVVSAT
jgi:hypothetical protein